MLPSIDPSPNDPDGIDKADVERIRRRQLVLGSLLDYLQRDFVKQTVAESLFLSADIAGFLLENRDAIHSTKNNSAVLLDDFMAPGVTLTDTLKNAYIRLEKIAGWLALFRLGRDELAYIVSHASDFAKISLDVLPVAKSRGEDVFKCFVTLARYTRLRDEAGAGLLGCLSASDAATRRKNVMLLTDSREAVVKDAFDAPITFDSGEGHSRCQPVVRVFPD